MGMTLDYQMDSKELGFGRKIHAEIWHEGVHQIFKTWIEKNGEMEGQAHTLFLKNWYNPEEYVRNFISECEEEESKIK